MTPRVPSVKASGSNAGTSRAAAATGATSVIFINIPGFPQSIVPGLGGVAFDPTNGTSAFDRVYGSPNGNYIMTATADRTASDNEVLILNGVVIQEEGSPGPWTNGTENSGDIDRRCEVNDAGDFTFSTNTSAPTDDDYIVTNVGGVWGFSAREGDQAQTLPGNVYGSLLDSTVLLADGTSGFAADGLTGTIPTTENDILVLGSTLLMQEGVTIPPGQIGTEFIENFDTADFFTSEDGAHYLVQGDLTGPTTEDDVVVVDGTVVLQENTVISGSGFPNPIDGGGIVAVFMDGAGNWFARGNNDSSETDWVVMNGSVVASTDQPILAGSTELWDDVTFAGGFFLHTSNGNGDFIIGGTTNSADITRNAVLVLNGTTEICREGDPLDLDGNGVFDDDAFISQFGDDDVFLSDAGILYLITSLRNAFGTTIGQVFFSMDLGLELGSNYCTAVANSSGVPAQISAAGSRVPADNDLTVTVDSLPTNQFGIFLTSMDQAFVPGANGTSNGNLCLGGSIGRFNQIRSSGAAGSFSLAIDVNAIPQGNGTVPILAGQTWNFQGWFRDQVGVGSNFSNGVEIQF